MKKGVCQAEVVFCVGSQQESIVLKSAEPMGTQRSLPATVRWSLAEYKPDDDEEEEEKEEEEEDDDADYDDDDDNKF
ncbi:unnamed protein product [Schistocephalus solidus]|uniref:Uncharacterized protein n=1 Tax=Schistocephalus solidus TaxID=70667 RepID=A0A183TP72_SCHSO|nr:unnamed protein product [Schistocephalus solidus]